MGFDDSFSFSDNLDIKNGKGPRKETTDHRGGGHIMSACVIAARARRCASPRPTFDHPKLGRDPKQSYQSCACIRAVCAPKLGQDSYRSCACIMGARSRLHGSEDTYLSTQNSYRSCPFCSQSSWLFRCCDEMIQFWATNSKMQFWTD